MFPGAAIAMVSRTVAGADAAIRNATALGPQRVSSADLEFAVRQLVEVAVRALSPGIDDPHTAISVLDRLGAALCDIVPLHLPTGVFLRDGWPALVVPSIDYDGLVDAMFHLIRQNAAGNAAVLIRLLEVLSVRTSVANITRRECGRCGVMPTSCWVTPNGISPRRPTSTTSARAMPALLLSVRAVRLQCRGDDGGRFSSVRLK